MDALCSWERNTGRRSTFVFIPHELDEKVILVSDGKPISTFNITQERILQLAMIARSEKQKPFPKDEEWEEGITNGD